MHNLQKLYYCSLHTTGHRRALSLVYPIEAQKLFTEDVVAIAIYSCERALRDCPIGSYACSGKLHSLRGRNQASVSIRQLMPVQLPVLAHNTGGPLETIKEGVTGWLRPASAEEWCAVIRTALFNLTSEQIRMMGEAGQRRVKEQFTKEKMAERLEEEFAIQPSSDRVGALTALLALSGVTILFLGIGVALL